MLFRVKLIRHLKTLTGNGQAGYPFYGKQPHRPTVMGMCQQVQASLGQHQCIGINLVLRSLFCHCDCRITDPVLKQKRPAQL